MAKNNNNNNSNYFSQMIAQKGENFLDTLTAKDIQFAAVRIFRDLARGRIDISKYGEYFLNRNFTMLLIEEAQRQYNIFEISSIAVQNFIAYNSIAGGINNSSINQAYNYQANCRIAYGIILDGLKAVLNTQNPAVLIITIQNLKQYKNSI